MTTTNFFKNLSVQEYIALGYLYLVLIGVINIVLYYSSLGVNIFDYIAISDILLAPINMLFLDYRYTLAVVLVISLVSYLLKFAFLSLDKKLETAAEKAKRPTRKIAYHPMMAFTILFSYVFLVLSANMAESVSSRVKNKSYRLNTTLTFADHTQVNVCVVATTSMYIFYVEEGEDVVTITPIGGNVKAIKWIKPGEIPKTQSHTNPTDKSNQ
jgi:hypothetical protein